ncbi:PLD nuclease N-terminal domain-containing protein [Paeniglutamicibacter sp. NPDC012692]|uniref:PLD nuclease N-terminal domain-containing protein n=1 Tax=Paeniglutamicibacter sp. NPDC012692 TaxID=3364388 RepID=UPI0036AECF10
MPRKKQWNELKVVSRWRIVILGLAQLALQFVALRDLIKRPAEQVNGSKGAWAAATFLNFIGPAAYLLFGRQHKSK